MFRILWDPSSGSTEPYLIEITRYGSQTFIVCWVGVWQRNFEPVLCVYCTTQHTINVYEPLRVISVKYGSVLPDDGSHKIRNMSEWLLILSFKILNYYTT
jgi:hypothetical protein